MSSSESSSPILKSKKSSKTPHRKQSLSSDEKSFVPDPRVRSQGKKSVPSVPDPKVATHGKNPPPSMMNPKVGSQIASWKKKRSPLPNIPSAHRVVSPRRPSLPSDEKEDLNVHLPGDLADMVYFYGEDFTGDMELISENVMGVAKHDGPKNIIYYLIQRENKNMSLVRLDILTGEKVRQKIGLKEYKFGRVECSIMKNYLVIKGFELILLLDLNTNEILSKINDPDHRNRNYPIEIAAIKRGNIIIVSTTDHGKYRLMSINLKNNTLDVDHKVSRGIRMGSDMQYIGANSAGELIFLRHKQLVKYF